MSKFKIGDRVRLVSTSISSPGGNLVGRVGEVVEVDTDDPLMPYRVRHNSSGFRWIDEDSLELVTDLDALQIGDSVDCAAGGTRKVLGVLPGLVGLSFKNNHESFDDWFTYPELEERGWRPVSEEPVKELTVDEISKELGYEVKVVRKSRKA